MPAHPNAAFSFGAVILAAGRSVRMGQPKLLLPWGQTSVLGHALNQWRHLGAAQVAVVCAEDDSGIEGELRRLGFPQQNRIFNPDPARGMFSSIQCAAGWPSWPTTVTHWAIALGDQPHLRAATLRATLALAVSHPEQVCQPAYGGRPRHPVILPRTVFLKLRDSTVTDLKAFLGQFPVSLCEISDPGLNLDIDRPEDYVNALRLL